MRVYRLCNRDEAEYILKNRNFEKVGHKCKSDVSKNNHHYGQDINYMHFFEKETSLLYLYPSKGKMICVYDIPDEILSSSIILRADVLSILYSTVDNVCAGATTILSPV